MKNFFIFLILFLIMADPFLNTVKESYGKISPANARGDETYTVWRVIDGDTLKLDKDERVVLIGVDAPELFLSRKLYDQSRRTGEKMQNIQAKGKLAARFAKQLVEGRKVRLRFDERIRDKRNQLLAYVFLQDDTFVNAEIVKQGYAKAVDLPPNNRYRGLFLKLEQEAKANKRGLWAYQKA
jgi:micrococcal nuclease